MLVLLAALVTAPVNATLTIASSEKTYHVGDRLQFTATIKNRGEETMLVVTPGDGSTWHLRAPFVGFAVREGRGPDFPKATPKVTGMRCGNMNPMTGDEVADLAPGKTWNMPTDWVGERPKFDKPGTYRIVFYYEIAGLGSRGAWTTDKAATERIQASQPYQLRSNELRITVKDH